MVVMTRGRMQKDRGNNPVTVHASKRAEEKIEECEQLLPGVLNEITIDQIAPKLPWTAFHMLSSVSRGWQMAIQSHQIYDARVRFKSTQRLVALKNKDLEDRNVSTIALFSIEDGSCYHLPPIPGLNKGLPSRCEWIWLDGKLYVLGGLQESLSPLRAHSAKVYMWDLAGQRQWRQCASMKEARCSFGCAIKDGKIYVFAGWSNSQVLCGSELYDPKEDAWSPFTPVPRALLRMHHKATVVGEEFFLHGTPRYRLLHGVKTVVQEDFLQIGEADDFLPHDILPDDIHPGVFAEVYDPYKDTWRIVKHFSRCRGKVLMVGGKLHRVNEDGIALYDHHANSWKSFKPFAFDVSEVNHFRVLDLNAAVELDDEVLATVNYSTINEEEQETLDHEGTCLIKSQGVGGKNTNIVWQRLTCSINLAEYDPQMCPIQL